MMIQQIERPLNANTAQATTHSHMPALRPRYHVKLMDIQVVREPNIELPMTITGPNDARAVLKTLIPDDDREHFWLLLLNTRNRLLTTYPLSTGTLSAALISPRETFRAALLGGATAIIVGHNHPSGDPSPSREDISVTKVLAEAGKVLGIPVRDHIIIGNGTGRWISLGERGYL